jgi:PHS family inorganic phosphate transporter-like MFS transporter
MQIYSLFMFLGIFSTLLIPETARITLEQLAGEYDMGGESITGGHVEQVGKNMAEDGSDTAANPIEEQK